MKIKTIFIGRRPARVTPRKQGGGRAKRLTCQGLIEVGGGEVSQILKFGGLGHTGLKVGEKALVFLSTISKKLYEDPWNGNIVIEMIGDEVFGIYPCKNLWLIDLVPAIIKSSSRQDPIRPNATAIRFSTLEAYLMTMIAARERIGGK